MVEVNHDKIPLYKLVVHVAQIALSVTIWCLEIAVFKGGDVNGNMGWTFGVCFLSIPAWIYLIMAPRYPRAANIAQPNALVTVDALMTIIWLSAFATQAAYNTANDCGTACGVSKAIVGLGVFETLLWALSTLISWATLQYYNTNGVLPGYDNLHRGRTHTLNDIDPDKAAFSTAPADEEAYAPLGGLHDHDDPMEPEFNAGPYHSTGAPSHHEPDSFGSSHLDTSYGGGGNSMNSRYDSTYDSHGVNPAYESHTSPGPAGGALYSPPQVHDEEYDGPAQFPVGNYDNIGLRQV